MKHSKITVLALVLCGLARPITAATESYQVDAAHTSAIFKASHFGISFVTGSFTDVSGTIVLDRNNPANSLAEILIQTSSIDTHDKKRDDHLRSGDFLDVENYPTMAFKSSNVKKLEENLFEVTGFFTLHGVTKTITTTVTFIGEGDIPWGEHRAGFETSFSINRTEYGMEKLLKPVGDKVQIILIVEAARKEEPGN